MCPIALADHGERQERWAARQRSRARLPEEYGNFLASLAPRSWFINPISFRDDWRNAHRPKDEDWDGFVNSQTKFWPRMRSIRSPIRPRLPVPQPGPPCSDEGLLYIGEFLADIEAAAGTPVGWVIAEEFGRLGGRWHAHGLVSGVSRLSREFWWREAFRRFGRTRIEPFDPKRAACFYAAKYAAKALGEIHVGGNLSGVELSRVVLENGCRSWDDSLADRSEPTHTHSVLLPSATVERTFFRLGLPQWHR